MGTILPPPQFSHLIGAEPKITEVAKSAGASLRRLADRVESSPDHAAFNVWEIEFAHLSFRFAFQMQSIFEQAFGRNAVSIYALEIVDGPDAETVLAEIKALKKRKEKKYPRLVPLDQCRESRTLYVGSSRATPKRLAEHLGTCHATTYGLRLGEWASHWLGRLRLSVWTFEEIESDILQVLEDDLASRLNPILGKRGGK